MSNSNSSNVCPYPSPTQPPTSLFRTILIHNIHFPHSCKQVFDFPWLCIGFFKRVVDSSILHRNLLLLSQVLLLFTHFPLMGLNLLMFGNSSGNSFPSVFYVLVVYAEIVSRMILWLEDQFFEIIAWSELEWVCSSLGLLLKVKPFDCLLISV